MQTQRGCVLVFLDCGPAYLVFRGARGCLAVRGRDYKVSETLSSFLWLGYFFGRFGRGAPWPVSGDFPLSLAAYLSRSGLAFLTAKSSPRARPGSFCSSARSVSVSFWSFRLRICVFSFDF